MGRKKSLLFSVIFPITALILAACNPIPATTPATDKAGTAVAATLTSIAAATSPVVVTEPDFTPTVQTTAAPAAVIPVSLAAGDGTLWIWKDGDTAAVQVPGITQVEQSLVSPDGSLIAFVKKYSEESKELAVVNVDGTNLRTLVSSDKFQDFLKITDAIAAVPGQLAWVPGTHKLAMSTRAYFMGPGSAVNPDLIIIDTDTGTSSTLLSVEETWQFWFSPDGGKIVVTLPDGINLYNSDGTLAAPEKFFTYPRVNTASEYQWTAKPVWKSDISAFAFMVPPAEPWTENPEDSRVFLISRDGAKVTNVLTTQAMFMPNPSISSDLSQIAYLAKPDAMQNNFEFHLASLSGSENVVYSPNSYVPLVSWSPDSRHFLYSVNINGINQAYLGTPGSLPIMIPQITSLSAMRWIDTNRYLILDMTGSGWKLWLGNITSSPVVVYSDTLSNETQAHLDSSMP